MVPFKPITLFIGNVAPSTYPTAFKDFLVSFGKVSQVQIPKISKEDDAKGYAYIKCLDIPTLKGFISQKVIYNQRVLCIREFLTPEKICQLFDFKNPKSILFVKQIPATITHDDLEAAFIRFGPVRSAYAIRPTKKDRAKFYGFVQFEEGIPSSLAKNTNVLVGNFLLPCMVMEEVPRFIEKLINRPPGVTNQKRFWSSNALPNSPQNSNQGSREAHSDPLPFERQIEAIGFNQASNLEHDRESSSSNSLKMRMRMVSTVSKTIKSFEENMRRWNYHYKITEPEEKLNRINEYQRRLNYKMIHTSQKRNAYW